jgi:hypothetical protein
MELQDAGRLRASMSLSIQSIGHRLQLSAGLSISELDCVIDRV